jgi:hypothetical protein
MAESSQLPPRARMKVHNSVTSLRSPPSTVRPLALSAACSAALLPASIGAGLFGMLFGHGLFGGMAGFASILGLLFHCQVGL